MIIFIMAAGSGLRYNEPYWVKRAAPAAAIYANLNVAARYPGEPFPHKERSKGRALCQR